MKNLVTVLLAIALPSLALQAKETVPTQGCMRVIPKDKDQKEDIDLPLKHTEVQAEISGFVTRVKVVQTFTNPYTDPIEAVYVFPLPQNAAVSEMQIRIGDRIVKGVIKKREEAKQIYEDAKKAGKTAALLEQERPNIFSQSVANIMPGNDILVEITYDEVLAYENGLYEFVFPMVVGPRFIPGTPAGQQAGGWSPDTDKVPDASRITPPVLKPGERNGHDINVTVKLNAGVPVRSLECPSHRVVVSPEPGAGGILARECTVRIEPNDAIPNKDFVIRYRLTGEKPQMGLLAHQGDLGGYFLLMFQPPETAATETVTPKEMVFVMDCSGSMSGEPISLSKKAVRYALENLNPGDTFQIIRFSESASPFAEEPLPATRANIRRGLSYINGLEGEGGTMMIEGIKAALDYPHRENRLRIVCFMTDGYIGNEAEILDAIQKKLGDDTRLFSFGVGSSVNRYLLESMAEVGRGEVQYILLNEKPDEAVKKFYERVRNPVLTHIRVDWAGLDAHELYPSRVRDLFLGQPVFVLGRYDRPGDATIRIHGKVGGQAVEYPLSVRLPATEPANAALAPLWARARIKELTAEQYGGENPDVVKEITEVALKYHLMSPYTSFVAVEEKVVNEAGEVRTIQVPVEMPEGVSYEGVFGREAQLAPMSGGGSVRGVLGFASFSAMAKCAAAPAVNVALMETADEADRELLASAEPMKPFTIEWKTAERTIRITRTGEIWIERGGTERMLAGRLLREQARHLWALLSAALKETGTSVAWAEAGELSVHLLDAQGAVEKTSAIQLGAKDAPVSEPWKKVLEFLQLQTG